ncbi:MAG TPA: hypothetical protein VGI39_32695 [Polyangiaceae bacterium]|jgi:uncharacterized membrane protein
MHDGAVLSAVLELHIAAGVLALLLGPAGMIARKGGVFHRRAGRAYVVAMWVTCLSAAAYSCLRGTIGMLTVPLPAFVFVVSGDRFAKRRDLEKERRTAIALLALGAFVCLVAARRWTQGDEGAGANLPVGIWALACAALDGWRAARGGLVGAARVAVHRSRMILSYAATVTAFLLTNVRALPMVLGSFAPTVIALVAIGLPGLRRPARSAGLQSKS